jgi:hypothetical protein
MPHATTDDTMGSHTQTNGTSTPTFKTLDHVTSYPVVSDSISAVKSHPYGKKSLDLAHDAYQRFGKPVEGYVQGPYSYVKPYVTKADELADSGLSQVDTRFPIVKEDSGTVIETAKGYVMWPFNYYTSTYNGMFPLARLTTMAIRKPGRNIPADRLR